jgi:hypothetical protein
VISDLAPMLRFTIRGRSSAEINGLVDLLDNKVLDARLLRQLLRHQAASLVKYCLATRPRTFRFQSNASLPQLFSKLPLDMSLLALLVDAAFLESDPQHRNGSAAAAWVRAPQRGQNLDRGGLDARYLKLFNLVTTPLTSAELARQAGLSPGEVDRVMSGFAHADLVVRQEKRNLHTIIAVTGDAGRARQLSDFFRVEQQTVSGKVVRDALAVKLLSRRLPPDQLVFDMQCGPTREAFEQLSRQCPAELSDAAWTLLVERSELETTAFPDGAEVLPWPDSANDMREMFCTDRENQRGQSELAGQGVNV